MSSPTDNLSAGLHKGKCQKRKSGLEYATFKDSTLTFKCVHCNKNYEKEFDDDLPNTYRFCDGDINRFFLMLRKGVYSYKHMDS